MSETPRTDAEYARLHCIYLEWASRKEMCCAFENDMQLARRLERELYTLNRRLKRLVEIGDQMAAWLRCDRNLGSDTFTAHLWEEAKKPLNDRS